MASERDGWEQELEETINKVNYLRKELVRAYDAIKKYSLESQISEGEEKITQLKAKIREAAFRPILDTQPDTVHPTQPGTAPDPVHRTQPPQPLSSVRPSHAEALLAREADERQPSRPTGSFFNRRLPRRRYGEISCDRGREMELLRQQFDRHRDEPFQHYFLSGLYDDKLDSLVERFIRQVLESDGGFDVHCPTAIRGEGYEPVLNVEPLPLRFDLESSKQALRSYFGRHLYLGPAHETLSLETLEDFFRSNLPLLQKDYLAVVFKVSREHRKPFLPAFFQWLVRDFCCGRHSKLKLLFFYTAVGQAPKAARLARWLGWGRKESALENDLEGIFAAHPCCYPLRPRPWVPASDLMDWFDFHSTKTTEARRHIERIKKDHPEYYNPNEDAFRMSVVEDRLRQIIEEDIRAYPAI